ncbi:uncharacterized protein PHALS_12030 [Plasmopara halstedii]|uniref:Uncharacterized protein n=1 Tax=Plasmopara halstedii TaxID=4781 RepID=A0A0N7L5K1_PLAHL|nr:uncharacterized protein PHALS_12030 [Plasmopara halstedii]CEG41699.1 hypothetical protein PHALS_12030 [Plasmopara halstedii]|eukprot:XP_024578068.1 hypothetical protein PHALS_12030 [Plasmopara halstedii]
MYIETKLQLADFLTKPISTKQFELMLDRFNIRNSPSRGSVEVSKLSLRSRMEEIGLFSQDFLAVGESAQTIPSEARIM